MVGDAVVTARLASAEPGPGTALSGARDHVWPAAATGTAAAPGYLGVWLGRRRGTFQHDVVRPDGLEGGWTRRARWRRLVDGATPVDPPYLRIAQEIGDRIRSGELTAGQRVPSARQIMRDYQVAIATATKALARLHDLGLVQAVAGIGTVVVPQGGTPTTPPTRTTRRRRSAGSDHEMNRERVISTALSVADVEGLAALSMRRMANELEVPTMSLYQYLPSKEQLIQGMVEAAMGEIEFPDPPPADWRGKLDVAARLQWDAYRRHPWLAQVISLSRPTINSRTLAQAEWMLAALDGLDLDANTMLHIQVALTNYVRGTAVNLEQEAQFRQDTGLTDEQWLEGESAEAAVQEVLASSAMPRFAKLFAEQNIQFNLDSLFDFGLRRLLDGIGVLVDGKRPA